MTYGYFGLDYPRLAWVCSCGGLLEPEQDGGSGSSTAELTTIEQIYLCSKCGQYWNHQQAFKSGEREGIWESLQNIN